MVKRLIETIKKNKASFAIGIVCFVATMVILLFPSRKKEQISINLSEYSSVNTICELATLKSYYHNVVTYEENPTGFEAVVYNVLQWPFGVYTQIGHKQFWMEYSGIVETGIDASQIKIVGPSADGVVEVYLPDAKILNIYADLDSMSDPLSESGWFTSISGEEKMDAFSEAQNKMRQEVENDQALLRRSKENAKKILERYIINAGKEMGADYTIAWI